jgi:hypothetical protein
MSKYEHIVLKGVPFLMDSARILYTYEPIGSKEPIAIGVADTDGIPTFYENWESCITERLSEWRTGLVPTERGKIRAQYKHPKQSRARKTTGKSIATA